MSARTLVLLVASAAFLMGQKLPLKLYTAADGLAHNSINRIVGDRRGYLWFCTSEGLSRFDGYEFHNYGRRDGLPHRSVNDILETRSGQLWIATSGGLCQYFPKESGQQRFRIFRPGSDSRASFVTTLLEDLQGGVWCGTEAGLFHLERTSGPAGTVWRAVDLGMPDSRLNSQLISALLQDSRGDLWVGAGSGLYRRRAGGRVEKYTTANGLPQDFITALLEDQQHRIWAGTNEGLCKLVADPGPGRRVVEAILREKDGLSADSVRVIQQLTDGTLCVGTMMGLSTGRADPATGLPKFSSYTAAHGLPATGVEALAQDTAGNIWIGTDGSGAVKLGWKTFLTYTAEDGLAAAQIDSIFEDGAGRLCVVAREGNARLYVSEFDGRRFRTKRVNLPEGTRLLNWGPRTQSVAHDGKGNWWVATSDGLFRYSGVVRISDLAEKRPTARYTERDGLPAGPIMSVFVDSAGVVWLSTTGNQNGLARWDQDAGTFQSYSQELPWLPSSGVSQFAQDGSGNLWMGLMRFGRGQAEVARLRGGAIKQIGDGMDASLGGIRALYRGRQGRLWVGTNQNGLMRFDHPDADQPVFRRYTTASGLSSDLILSLSEDRSGRIYAGNGSGVDRLDVATGQIKRYTSADGLATGEVHASFCDHNGVLWFGTSARLSRLEDTPDHPIVPLSIAITSLRVGGVRQPTSELGEPQLSGLEYQSNQNHVEVGFTSVDFAPGDTLNYEYMLQGADSEWSSPSTQRIVSYANLSPGSYRFLVRAINSDGVSTKRPASVEFVILPPIWLRWWFQSLAAAIIGAAAYRLHRYRLRHLLALERVRTRIATDLHDDIGSSLSQIAILSEVANRQVDAAHSKLAQPLTDIAGISRELVESMSDIVWAIDPERDKLGDLVHRMRRFASDVLAPKGIRLEFQPPSGEQDLPMGANLRRQVFLIFKEAIHNVLRHSGATEVSIDFQVNPGWLVLKVSDNGKGFPFVEDQDGHGLRSMRERSKDAGGAVEIQSGFRGTTVTLRVPVG